VQQPFPVERLWPQQQEFQSQEQQQLKLPERSEVLQPKERG
jgi:hypothetical protein